MKTHKLLLSIFVLFLSLTVSAQVDYETIQVKSNYYGGWGTNRTKLVSKIPGFTSKTDGSDDYTRYGTYKYLRTDSTGYFYAKKIDGRWWMVDPDGYAGINIAATSFTSSAIQDEYDIIRRNGYNGTGNFLSSESQTKSGYNFMNYSTFSFTRRLNFFLNYKNVRKNYYTTPAGVQGSLDHILVFDPKFEEYADNLANTNVTPFVEERDLLGWFTDNEINFNQDQLRNLVKDLPAGDPSRDSALVFAASKGLTENDCISYTSIVTESIKQEFAAKLAERYFRIVSAAIRKYDPNHLILGSRFHGRPRGIQAVVNASHKYMDVTSVNFYDKFAPDEQIANQSWTADKPCIIGEFYIKDINVFNTEQSGAGWYVNSQANRGYFYQNTCLELLKNKCFIGWQYFRFMDDTGSNKGIVNTSRTEYTGMTAYMNELNKQVYSLCDFFDGKDRRPNYETIERTLNVNEDTYVIPGSSNTSNFGTEAELEICYNTTESNRREAFLKFDLTSVKELLPNLKHAELEVTCTVSDRAAHSIFASGIVDNSWSETSLTGAIRQANSDWKNGYNRIDFKKGAILKGLNSFDVTTWLANQSTSGTVSFKIHDFSAITDAVKIASKENGDINARPRLKLTFWDKSTAVATINDNRQENLAFPNPAKGSFRVMSNDVVELQLLTLNGQKLLDTNNSTMDVSGFSNGVYLVKATNKARDTQYSKLIIKN